MNNKTFSRWHRFDTNGVKHICNCDVFKHPEPLEQDGYTPWRRGTGPHTPEGLKNVQNGLRKACLGVPKTPEQKEKMRQAKLGKKKSAQTRDKMRQSHKLRSERLKAIDESNKNNIQIQERQVEKIA